MIDYQNYIHICNVLKINYKKIHVIDYQLLRTLDWHKNNKTIK